MDKSSLLQEIGLLKLAHDISQKNPDFEKLDLAKVSILSQAYEIYQIYTNTSNTDAIDLGNGFAIINDLAGFCDYFGKHKDLLNKLTEIIKKENGLGEEPIKEESSVPVTLDAMVYDYQKNKADEANLEDYETNSTVEAIKRARSTQANFRKANFRAQQLKQSSEDEFFSKFVDTKDGGKEKTEYEIRQAVSVLISVQLQLGDIQHNKNHQKLIEELVYQVETGAIDLENEKKLKATSAVIIGDYYEDFKHPYQELDQAIKEKQIKEELGEDIDYLDLNILAKKTEAKVEQEEVNHKAKGEPNFSTRLKRADYDKWSSEAKNKVEKIQNGLSKAIPNSTSPFSRENFENKRIEELERLINKYDPKLLDKYSSNGSLKTIEVIKSTGSNVNTGLVGMMGKGLDEKKLNAFLEKHSDKPEIKRIKNGTQFYLKQIDKVKKSPLFKDISLGKHTNAILNPKATIENYFYKKAGQQAGKAILQVAGKKYSRKFGNFIFKHGLAEGSKLFADAVAKRLLIAGAKKMAFEAGKIVAASAAGSALAAASALLGISTAGLSLIIEAAILIIKLKYEVFKAAWKKITGKEFNFKDVASKAAVAGISLWALGVGIKNAGRGFAVATQAAVISAVGIIILSLTTIAVFLTLTFLTAPLLSTFVQFDSMRKVDYEQLAPDYTPPASECTWPVKGHFVVAQGPLGLETHKDGVQGIDIMGTSQSPVYAVGPGKVVHSGFWWKWPIYGNTIIIETKTTTGTFQVWYNHLSEMGVNVGQDIKQGDQIGRTGNTGISLGWTMADHLHMEYRNTNFEAGTVEYNKCAAGGVPVPEKCVNNYAGASDCNYKGQLIYTDTTP